SCRIDTALANAIGPKVWNTFIALWQLAASTLGLVADVLALTFNATKNFIVQVVNLIARFSEFTGAGKCVAEVINEVLRLVQAAAGAFAWLVEKVRDVLGMFKSAGSG